MVSASTGRFTIDKTPKNIEYFQIQKPKKESTLAKSITSISAESATLKMPFWTGSTGFIDIAISDMGKEMKIPILDPIDAEIATMTEDEINAEIDAMFGAWKDRPELTVESLTNIWGGWAKSLSKIDNDEPEDHSV